MAQALESDPEVEMILGMGTREPSVPLERTEFVRADQTYSILSRIVRATQVDTIVHTFLVVDSTRVSSRALHEINVIGTMNLLAAAGQSGSPVRQVVVKSSTLVYGSASTDPTWFREEMPRTSPGPHPGRAVAARGRGPRPRLRRGQPATVVTVLRFANVLGTDIVTPISTNLSRPLCPCDRRLRPARAVRRGGRRRPVPRARHPPPHPRALQRGRRGQAPLERGGRDLRYPPPALSRRSATQSVAAPLVRLGLIEFPPELGEPAALRPGRRHDPRSAKTGFTCRYTSAGAVESFIRAVRPAAQRRASRPPSYTYEQDVEQFFRHSPAVVRSRRRVDGRSVRRSDQPLGRLIQVSIGPRSVHSSAVMA